MKYLAAYDTELERDTNDYSLNLPNITVVRNTEKVTMNPKGPYDSEIEYLQSSGTQRIHTGINGDVHFIGYAQASSLKGSSQVLLAGVPGASGSTWFGEAGSLKKWGTGTSTGNYVNIASTTAVIFNLTFSSTNGITGTVNGLTLNRSALSSKQEWSIFASINGSYPFSGKLYFLKMYDINNELVRDFIPVRVGSVGYMYDKISKQLFGNVGTGSFILGPDKL